MKIEHLRLFVFIANSPSINYAAQRLFISQQQLNRIITSLENELKIKLIKRSNKGITLTDDGIYFLEYANKILSTCDDFISYFSKNQISSQLTNTDITGQCTLYVPLFFSVFLNDFIFKFKEIAPGIKLTCIEEQDTFSMQKTINGLHLITYVASEEIIETAKSHLTIKEIGSYKLFLIVNKKSEFAKKISINSSEEFPCFYTLFPFMSEAFSNKNELLFISTNISQHMEAVGKYNSVFSAPDFVLPKLRSYSQDIAFIPLNEDITYHQYIIYPNEYQLSAAESVLISFTELYLKHLSLIAKQLTFPSVDIFN